MQDIEKIVSYIEKEMDFYSYEDFYLNAKAIKKLYEALEHRTNKLIYKWYIYSRDINYSQKNRIWDYLNNDKSLGDLMDYEMNKSNKKKGR